MASSVDVFYSERNGTHVSEQLDALWAEPEQPLTPHEVTAVRSFAAGLMEGEFTTDTGLIQVEPAENAPRSLTELLAIKEKAEICVFYTGYFSDETGHQDLASLGLDPEMAPAEVASELSNVAIMKRLTTDEQRQDVASRSKDWFVDQVVDRMKANDFGEADSLDQTVTVNYNPDKLLVKLEGLQAHRRLYRQIRSCLREADPSPLNEAKRAVLDIYTARINQVVAELYPLVAELIGQCFLCPETDTSRQYLRRLELALPRTHFIFPADKDPHWRQQTMKSFARKLDFLRMGAAQAEDTAFTPFSEAHLALAEQPQVTEAEPALLPEPVVEHIKTTSCNAETVKRLCEAALQTWDLLSDQPATYQEAHGRETAAKDNKWQVVLDPHRKSLSTDSMQKIVYVPISFDRKLGGVSPAGGLAGVAHELTHVLQAEYDSKVQQNLPLAKLKGRRAVTLREQGAIHQEKLLQTQLGQTRPARFSYLKAMRVKENSGSIVAVSQAYLESKGSGQPVSDKSRRAAVRNSLRLYRHGGYDTQALDYSEQALIDRELRHLPEDQQRSISIGLSAFSLADTAKLRKYGLLSTPPAVPEQPAQTVIKIFCEKFLPDELKTTAN